MCVEFLDKAAEIDANLVCSAAPLFIYVDVSAEFCCVYDLAELRGSGKFCDYVMVVVIYIYI